MPSPTGPIYLCSNITLKPTDTTGCATAIHVKKNRDTDRGWVGLCQFRHWHKHVGISHTLNTTHYIWLQKKLEAYSCFSRPHINKHTPTALCTYMCWRPNSICTWLGTYVELCSDTFSLSLLTAQLVLSSLQRAGVKTAGRRVKWLWDFS